MITVWEVVQAAKSGQPTLLVGRDAIITPAARDEAVRLGVNIVLRGSEAPSSEERLAVAETKRTPLPADDASRTAELAEAIVTRLLKYLNRDDGNELCPPSSLPAPQAIAAAADAPRAGPPEAGPPPAEPKRAASPSMALEGRRRPAVIAFDAGGTMTDAFIVDEEGQFVVGKSQTTPDDESRSVIASTGDALTYWDMTPDQALPTVVSGVFSGTSMLNRLLSRQGGRIGIITNKGAESVLKMGRGAQSYLGYSYSDRLHVNSHAHHEPLVPLHLIKGVTERIDHKGAEVVPLYEHEVEAAARALQKAQVAAIVVCLLHSYVNPAHERRVGEIVRQVVGEGGGAPQIFLSCDYYPMRGETARLNTTVIEAYAAEPSRKHLSAVDAVLKGSGGRFDLRVMASHGGTISIQTNELARTLVSGPIGGIVGAKYLSQYLGIKNVACTDIGGTTFDMGLITNGDLSINARPSLGQYLLSVPMVAMDSVGSGTGSFVRIDPIFGSIQIGPDSAGSRIGVCNADSGLDTVSITDCHIVLGILDPNYFLGGDVVLDPDRAYRAVETQLAKPLGLDVYRAAAGVVELLEAQLGNALKSLILQEGHTPSQYVMMSYGGGGPVHAVGLAKGLGFADIIAPSWAAGFSAFGCATADFEYRADRTLDIPIGQGTDADVKRDVANRISEVWNELERYVQDEFSRSGSVGQGAIEFRRFLRMQYQGQLNDIAFESPLEIARDHHDVDRLVAEFEKVYGEVFVDAARSPELGWAVTGATVRGTTEVKKPHIPVEPDAGPTPSSSSRKGTRRVFWGQDWMEAQIYQMEELRAGNRLSGLAIIESPATTLVVPPGFDAVLDIHRIFHINPNS